MICKYDQLFQEIFSWYDFVQLNFYEVSRHVLETIEAQRDKICIAKESCFPVLDAINNAFITTIMISESLSQINASRVVYYSMSLLKKKHTNNQLYSKLIANITEVAICNDVVDKDELVPLKPGYKEQFRNNFLRIENYSDPLSNYRIQSKRGVRIVEQNLIHIFSGLEPQYAKACRYVDAHLEYEEDDIEDDVLFIHENLEADLNEMWQL